MVFFSKLLNLIASNILNAPIASAFAVYSGDSKDTWTWDWAARLYISFGLICFTNLIDLLINFEVLSAWACIISELINKSITDSDLPNGIRIGLIKRDDKILVPDKETIIRENDEIVIMCLSESIHDAEELFQVRGAF